MAAVESSMPAHDILGARLRVELFPVGLSGRRIVHV